MQGSLSSPYKLLQVIAQKELTGCLSISIPHDNSISWKLYLGGSRLYYASTNFYQHERFEYLWQQITQDLPLPQFSTDQSEYESLYKWQVEHQISLTNFRRILLNLSREAIIHSISHSKAYLKFESDTCIKPVFIAAPLPDLIKPISNHIRFWQKLHTNIPSAFSRLYLDRSKIKEFTSFWETANNDAPLGKTSVQNISLSVWLNVLEQKLSIYEICRQLQVEPHIVCLWLNPLIESKVLEVFTAAILTDLIVSQVPNGPLVACIDDSNTVQRQIKMVLEMSGFQVLGITDPTSCLTSLVRQKPELILMDISMPEIDGYELCTMLRQSRHLRNVPIIMFTGREGIIDRMRAQLVGANDYITKPVNADKLIAKVQRLLQSSQNPNNQHSLDVGIDAASRGQY